MVRKKVIIIIAFSLSICGWLLFFKISTQPCQKSYSPSLIIYHVLPYTPIQSLEASSQYLSTCTRSILHIEAVSVFHIHSLTSLRAIYFLFFSFIRSTINVTLMQTISNSLFECYSKHVFAFTFFSLVLYPLVFS